MSKETQSAHYRLLGVDPGTNILGFAITEVRGKNMFVVEMGVLKLQQYTRHEERLQHIFERMQQLIRHHQPREMAIEAPFYGKNAQSMLKLGRAQGVAIAAAMTNGVDVCEYSPRKIKQAVTGNGNASKEQVAALLGQQLGLNLSEYLLDATDALAAAFCHYCQSRTRVGAGRRYNGWEAFLKDHPDRKSEV